MQSAVKLFLITGLTSLLTVPKRVLADFGVGDAVESTSYVGGAGFFGFLRRVGISAFDPTYVYGLEQATQTGQQNVLIVIAAYVLNAILSILGVVLVVYLFYGGFVWLKSKGESEEIERAQGIIRAAIIGIIIVVAAFVLARFVVNALWNATLHEVLRSNNE